MTIIFLWKCVFMEMLLFLYLWIVYGCFWAPTADWSSSSGDFMAMKPRFTIWSFKEKVWCSDACSVTQSCLILCDSMDCIPPGSVVLRIFQARLLQWVTISYSDLKCWGTLRRDRETAETTQSMPVTQISINKWMENQNMYNSIQWNTAWLIVSMILFVSKSNHSISQ